MIVPHKNKNNAEKVENNSLNNLQPISKTLNEEQMSRILAGFYSNYHLNRLDQINKEPINIELLLKENLPDDFQMPKFSKATFLGTNDLNVVFNESSIVEYPSDNYIILCRDCAVSALKLSDSFSFPIKLIDVNEITDYILSEDGAVLILTDSMAQYVFFDMFKIPLDKAEKLLNTIGALTDFLKLCDFHCPWESINDEQFEELCYDVISQSERYNPKSIRKMGKSRSRDGGRDIVVDFSKDIFGPKGQCIFQCKLIKTGKSLSGSNINISDTIDQYGAAGYGIITNTVIDSTLYDKLDGIAKNRSIKIDTYSKFELERFLARRLDIKQRYFNI
jgi:hypothetical protein